MKAEPINPAPPVMKKVDIPADRFSLDSGCYRKVLSGRSKSYFFISKLLLWNCNAAYVNLAFSQARADKGK